MKKFNTLLEESLTKLGHKYLWEDITLSKSTMHLLSIINETIERGGDAAKISQLHRNIMGDESSSIITKLAKTSIVDMMEQNGIDISGISKPDLIRHIALARNRYLDDVRSKISELPSNKQDEIGNKVLEFANSEIDYFSSQQGIHDICDALYHEFTGQ